MTATSFPKMRRRSGYGLTRASGSCSALTLLLTSLGHDSGSASDSVPRRWHGGASLGLVLGWAVDTWSTSAPGRFWMGSPCSPRTWKLDTTFMSPSYLAVPVRCLGVLLMLQCLVLQWIHVTRQLSWCFGKVFFVKENSHLEVDSRPALLGSFEKCAQFCFRLPELLHFEIWT